jgi:hypothetical protein
MKRYLSILFVFLFMVSGCAKKDGGVPNPVIDNGSKAVIDKEKNEYSVLLSSDNGYLLLNTYDSLFGMVVVQGYYNTITHKEDNGSEYSVDALCIVKAPFEFNQYYKKLIEQGNTVNSVSSTGNLIIGLNMSQEEKDIIAKATADSPVNIVLHINDSKDAEANTYFSISGILRDGD